MDRCSECPMLAYHFGLCRRHYIAAKRAGTLPAWPPKVTNPVCAARVLALASAPPPKPQPARNLAEGRAIKSAIGRLLPIPPQRPCPGVPGEVRCHKLAQPGSPYCLRCGPIAAAAGLSIQAA